MNNYINAEDILKQIRELPLQEQARLKDMLDSEKEDKKGLETYLLKHRFANGRVCPHCGGSHVRKNGHRKDGSQKYICVSCNKSFMITTNTIYSGTHKDISVWRKFLECMADKKTLDQSAEICGITHHTAFVWRHKLLDALAETADNTILNDIVEADETFLPISYKGNAMHFESLPNELPRNRGGLHTRGLSDELVCIPCAVDLKGNSVSRIAKLGKCSKDALHKVFEGRIADNTIICSDGDSSYKAFAENNNLNLIQIKGGKKSFKNFNIQRINNYHSQLKKFLDIFNGVSTKYLNNYLIWNNVLMYGKVYLKNRISILFDAAASAYISIRAIDINKRPTIPILV